MANWLLHGDYGTAPDDLGGMLLGLMLAFLCGHVIAWVYMACHSGLSYSRSFVNALIVLCLIVAVENFFVPQAMPTVMEAKM